MIVLKNDSSKKKGLKTTCCIIMIVTLFITGLLSSFSYQKECLAAQKIGKVKANSIDMCYSNMNTFVYKFKWKKVKNVDGYQVRVIEAESYDFDNIIRTIDRHTTFSNKARFELESADDLGVYDIRVQVRAFKFKGTGYKYGPWSTSSSFMLYV